MSAKRFKTVILATLIAGSLDIQSAFIDYYIQTGKAPAGVLKYISSGVFGNDAFCDGDKMIWLGLLFHYIIAFLFTIVFFVFYPKIKLLHINVILSAIIFGVITWAVMNLIVVPLSNTPKFPFNFAKAIKAMLILICMIGLPLAIIFKRHYKIM